MKLIKQIFIITAVVTAFAVVAVSRADAAYTRDLTAGSTGQDVADLQAFLVGEGYLIMPTSATPGYFGPLTQAALAKYQAANGIAPAVGYFGPITRAFVISQGVSTGLIDVKKIDDSAEEENDDEDDNDSDTSSTNKSVTINSEDDTYESFSADDPGEGDVGHFSINFRMTAGDNDVYVGGANYEFSNSLTGFSTSTSFNGPSNRKQGNGNYKVSAGTAETFTITVELEADPTTANTAQKMWLSEILWNTDNSDSDYESYTSRLDRYETPELFLRGIN